MKVYIATSLGEYMAAHEMRCTLMDKMRGHYEFVSRWHNPDRIEAYKRLADMGELGATAIAQLNFADLRKADVLLLLANEECRGALVELGYAFGRGIGVVVAGWPPTLMARGEHAVVIDRAHSEDIIVALGEAYRNRGAR